jgi:glucose-1-phosphate thymidylyltransferase
LGCGSEELAKGDLSVIKIPRGRAWLDLGTPKSLLEARKFIEIVEEHQGLQVGNPMDAAKLFGWI